MRLFIDKIDSSEKKAWDIDKWLMFRIYQYQNQNEQKTWHFRWIVPFERFQSQHLIDVCVCVCLGFLWQYEAQNEFLMSKHRG